MTRKEAERLSREWLKKWSGGDADDKIQSLINFTFSTYKKGVKDGKVLQKWGHIVTLITKGRKAR